MEEPAEKLSNSDLDKILSSVGESAYTFGHICALISKLTKVKNNTEMEEFINRMKMAIHTFNEIQVFWASDICNFFKTKIG